MSKRALICVDVQHDFLPEGALAVPHGDEVVEPLFALAGDVDYVVVTADVHPPDHCSFVEQGGLWPPHCVEGTRGSHVATILRARADLLIEKGKDRTREEYSGFTPELNRWLHGRGVTDLVIGGLATEYCVKATVLDAVANDFNVTVWTSTVRHIDVADAKAALLKMADRGAEVVGPWPS